MTVKKKLEMRAIQTPKEVKEYKMFIFYFFKQKKTLKP